MHGDGGALRTVTFAVGAPVLLIAALALGRPYLVPIAVAILIWFLINAMAEGLQRIAPRLPFLVATIVSVAILFGLVLGVIEVVANNVGALGAGLSGVDDQLIDLINKGLAAIGLDRRIDMEAVLRGLRLEELAAGALGAARSLASDVSLVFLYVMFLLVDQRWYLAKLRILVPDEARRAVLRDTLLRIAEETRAYLWLMTLLSAGVGFGTFLACAAFGVAGAGFWGFLAFALNFIPTIGSILAVAFPALYALLQLESDATLFALIAALAGLQFTAGEIVLPRLMGDRLNLSSFVILLSLVIWGAIWGPAGMFLAIPIMVILMIVFAEFPQTRPIAVVLSKTGALPEPPRRRAAPQPIATPPGGA
jgi:predicted PurR-regulated permease PerM